MKYLEIKEITRLSSDMTILPTGDLYKINYSDTGSFQYCINVNSLVWLVGQLNVDFVGIKTSDNKAKIEHTLERIPNNGFVSSDTLLKALSIVHNSEEYVRLSTENKIQDDRIRIKKPNN